VADVRDDWQTDCASSRVVALHSYWRSVDLKLLEDLMAFAKERSFVRAAEVRHVTHPAFGRRIRALEAWAGVTLIDRTRNPAQLTEAGLTLVQHAEETLSGLALMRTQLRSRQEATGTQVLRIGTGRTLARTAVADWLASLARPDHPMNGHKVILITGSMADAVLLLERGEVDLMCCYEHPASFVRLSSQQFRYVTLGRDKLVPVSCADANGVALHDLHVGPLIAYSGSLSLGALLHDHLRRNMPDASNRTRFVCDSPDAIHELVRKGLGISWLPWSLVAGDCTNGTLLRLGARSDELHFDVRLYRPRARQFPLVEAVWRATDL
jgi:DNA-binding transcriptional LysR family regulator